jgi:O-antigen/teichoic acid export membrane protein
VQIPKGGSSTLLSRATHALGWSFINNAAGRLGTLGIGIVLARLLGPHAFGTFAVALVALAMLLSFNELGVSLAIVRWQGDPREIAPTVATISIATSVLIYIGCFLGAPAFSSAMGAPTATNVVRVLAINVIIDGVVSTPVAMMQRHFQQGKKMIADQANSWLGAGVSVTLAVIGFGAMSLAIGRLTGALVSGVLYVALSPEPLRLGFNPGHARALLRFGVPLAGASIIVFAITDADQLVVGHFLGATMLGYYALATNLSNWPVNMFSVPVRSVAPALFSRLQHDPKAMRTGFVSGMGLLASVALPICLILSGAAWPLIGFVYGPRWALAAEALVWLGVFSALRILFEFVYDYFVVLARSRVVFTVQLVWLIVLVPALVFGAKRAGIAGVGMAEVAVAALLVVPWYLYELSRVGIPLPSLWRTTRFPLAAALGVELFAIAASQLIHRHVVALIVIGLLALATVALLLRHMKPQLTTLRPILAGNSGDVSAMDPTADGESVAAQLANWENTITGLATTAPLPVYRETAAPVVTYRNRAERFVYPQGADQPPLPGRHRKPVYPQAAEPIATYHDQDGRLAFPPVPNQPRLPGRHRRPEAQDVADTAAPAVLPESPANRTHKRRAVPDQDLARHDG